MRQTLNRMQQRGKDDHGFTMIELLVVVVIIGVLVAIAVPVYLNYRKGAANKSAASDVRGAITVIEQYYTENNNTYPTSMTAAQAGAVTFNADSVISLSPGNQLWYVSYTTTAGGAAYKICGWNTEAKTVYSYNSGLTSGGGVRKTTYADLAACTTATGA